MTGLTEFLLARIAEDEEVARGALEGRAGSGAPWVNVGTRHLRYDSGAGEDVAAIRVEHPAGPWERIYVKRDVDGLTADHIARHDPARVLAECEAKRAIVAEHEPFTARIGRDETPSTVCEVCRRNVGQTVVAFPCATLRALALPYAGHDGYDGYDEEWRP